MQTLQPACPGLAADPTRKLRPETTLLVMTDPAWEARGEEPTVLDTAALPWLASRHGGRATLENREGGGARVGIALPASSGAH